MNFCDDCDSLIKPKKDDNGIVRDYCGDCGEFKGEETSENTGSIAIPNEAREELEEDPEGGKLLILDEDDGRTVGRPSREMFCSNCQSMQDIEYWEIQTRSADESATRFFKCLECKKQWREYD